MAPDPEKITLNFEIYKKHIKKRISIEAREKQESKKVRKQK